MMRARCVGSESIVVSVDYRLAPEHRFPVGVEDCYAGLVWAANNAAALNGDGSRVTVGGVSAGGVATAVVALMARERGGPPLRLQLLEAASTDLTTSSLPGATPNTVTTWSVAPMLRCISLFTSDIRETSCTRMHHH